MLLSKLSGDEQGIILGQLWNPLEPRLAIYFSSACTELRALLPPAVRQQLRADHELATALCVKMGMRSCKELRRRWGLGNPVDWRDKRTSLFLGDAGIGDARLVALAPALYIFLGDDGPVPALECLYLCCSPLGDERLAALLAPPPPAGAPPLPAGGLKKLKVLYLEDTQVTDAGCAALTAALDSGALPALEALSLHGIPASDAAKDAVHVALAKSRAAAAS